MNPNTIVITGTGAVSAIGETLAETWNSLLNRTCGIQKISSFDASAFPCQIAAEVVQFDLERVGNAYQRKRFDKTSMLAIAAAEEALLQSGILHSSLPADRIGVFWSSGNGGIRTADAGMMEFAKHPDRKAFSPFFQSNVLIDTAGARIAQKFYLRGPNLTTVSACASGNTALQTAMAYLQAGLCDAAIVGGSEAAVSPSVLGGFSSMKALSRKNEHPKEACRPFSESRDGFVIGEGSAAMVLEKITEVEKRSCAPKCILRSVANANDAGHITLMDEHGEGASRSIQLALEYAGLAAVDIDAYSAHGTSTKQGDLSEYRSLQNVFREHLNYLPICASKSMTGHLLGASSALEAVFSIEMIHQQKLLPNLVAEADLLMDSPKLFMPFSPVETTIRNVMNHASGFGGQHATSIFSKL